MFPGFTAKLHICYCTRIIKGNMYCILHVITLKANLQFTTIATEPNLLHRVALHKISTEIVIADHQFR